jgi:hypothetical protein
VGAAAAAAHTVPCGDGGDGCSRRACWQGSRVHAGHLRAVL